MDKLRKGLTMIPPLTLSLLTFLAILWLTLAPKPLGEEPPSLFEGADKVVHAIMFGGFAWMIDIDYQRRHGWKPLKLRLAADAAFFSFCLGVIIECMQRNMDLGRGFDPFDIIADGCGCILAVAFQMICQKKWSV